MPILVHDTELNNNLEDILIECRNDPNSINLLIIDEVQMRYLQDRDRVFLSAYSTIVYSGRNHNIKIIHVAQRVKEVPEQVLCGNFDILEVGK